MSWYLFNNSPERQYRGKKVDGYAYQQKEKVIMDWGLGELSPSKQSRVAKPASHLDQDIELSKARETVEREYAEIEKKFKEQQESKAKSKVHKNSKDSKTKAVSETIKILTESSDNENDILADSEEERQKQELERVLLEYSEKKKQEKLRKKLLEKERLELKQYINKAQNQSQEHLKKQKGHKRSGNQTLEREIVSQNSKFNSFPRNNPKQNIQKVPTALQEKSKQKARQSSNSQNILNEFRHVSDHPYQNKQVAEQQQNYQNRLQKKSFKKSSSIHSNDSNNGIQQNPSMVETAKRMRYLENSLLPVRNKHDQVTAILDFDLNAQLMSHGNQSYAKMSDSRVSGVSQRSGKTHFGNKKNESTAALGDGYNQFKPIRLKVKQMNDRLKEMYDYDEMCKKRQVSQIKMG